MQISVAYGHRGLNLQAAGGSIGLGTSPGRIILVDVWPTSGTGTRGNQGLGIGMERLVVEAVGFGELNNLP